MNLVMYAAIRASAEMFEARLRSDPVAVHAIADNEKLSYALRGLRNEKRGG